MEFWKMNGAGNDFIILDNRVLGASPARLGRIARALCRRRFSIGADGLMAVEEGTQGGDFKMRFYNSDGSLGEMCGNGARCICRYGYERGLAGDVQRVETTAGLVVGTRLGPDSGCSSTCRQFWSPGVTRPWGRPVTWSWAGRGYPTPSSGCLASRSCLWRSCGPGGGRFVTIPPFPREPTPTFMMFWLRITW